MTSHDARKSFTMVVIRVKRAGRVTAGVLVGTTLAVCLFRLVRHRLRKKSEYCAGDSGRGLGSKQPAVSQSEVMEAVDRVAGILRPDILEMNAWHGIHFREDVDQPVGLWHVQPQSVRQVSTLTPAHSRRRSYCSSTPVWTSHELREEGD